jgi:hypothetical protein
MSPFPYSASFQTDVVHLPLAAVLRPRQSDIDKWGLIIRLPGEAPKRAADESLDRETAALRVACAVRTSAKSVAAMSDFRQQSDVNLGRVEP